MHYPVLQVKNNDLLWLLFLWLLCLPWHYLCMAARPSSRQLWTAKLHKTTQAQGLHYDSLSCQSTKYRPYSTAKQKAHTLLQAKGPSISKSFKGCILGVDPSLRRTGLVVIDYQGAETVRLLHKMALPFKSTIPLPTCLAEISKAVAELLTGYPIDHVALEQTVFVQNYQTAQILGAVRGAIIATAGLRGLSVFEYPPLRIKQALTGFGRASKEQVAKMVAQILKIPFNFSLDEGDAAAAALCHAFTHK